MQNKLLTLSALVDHLQNEPSEPLEDLIRISNWSDFIKQTVKLGAFIPCGEDGKPMDRPTKNRKDHTLSGHHSYTRGLEAYEKAEAAVLFEGWHASKEFCNEARKGNLKIYKSTLNKVIFYMEDIGSFRVETLSDLAELTKSNPLTLKQ